jgi:sugar (pentulose or hexulose) kinase
LGIDLPPAATWPLPRLLWFLHNEPVVLERAHRVLQAKDFVNFRLTGEFCSDLSSNRGMVSFEEGRVADRVFQKLKLPQHIVPRLAEPQEVIGRLTQSASEQTGLPPGVPVVAGWNDLNASVLGSGAVVEGQLFNVTGTSEHLGVIVPGISSS